MHIDEHSIRSSLMLIGTVIALSALIGFGLPAFSDNRPAGSDSVAEAWFTPAPTATATVTPEPSPTSQPTAIARVVQMEPASGATKTAYIPLDTPTLVPQILVMQAMSATVAAPSTMIDVSARDEQGPATAATLTPTALTSYQPPVEAVPIPVVREPSGAPGSIQAAAPQTRLSPTIAATPQLAGAVFTATLPSTPPAVRRLDAAPALTPAPSAPTVSTAASAAQVTFHLAPTPQPTTATTPVAPELINPPADARLSGMTTFEWHPTDPLAPGTAYEIVVWSPDQIPDQARGIAPATMMTSQQVNLEPLFDGGQFRTGHLYWTVIVVQQAPYQRLTSPGEGEARYLVRRTGG